MLGQCGLLYRSVQYGPAGQSGVDHCNGRRACGQRREGAADPPCAKKKTLRGDTGVTPCESYIACVACESYSCEADEFMVPPESLQNSGGMAAVQRWLTSWITSNNSWPCPCYNWRVVSCVLSCCSCVLEERFFVCSSECIKALRLNIRIL